MNLKQAVILIIDDEVSVRKTIRAYLETYNYEVLETASGRDGLSLCLGGRVDLVLLDIGLPGLSGIDVLRQLRNRIPHLPVLMISGKKNLEEALDAMRLGARDYLTKPLSDMEYLRTSIERSLEHVRFAFESQHYKEMLEARVAEQTKELTVANERLRRVLESARKFISCTNLETDGHMILEEFVCHMSASGGSLYQVSKEKMTLAAGMNLAVAPPLEITFPLSEDSIFTKVIENKRTIIVERYSEALGDGYGLSCPDYVSKSVVVFPFLDHKDEIVALITLFDKVKLNGQTVPFNSQDREIGSILASCAGESLRTALMESSLRRCEELMLKAQKRNSIGILASGIAHDFNNILSAIVGYTDLSLCADSCSESVRGNLEQVQKASQRARDLVQQILSLSRAESTEKTSIELSSIIEEALDFVRATLPTSIVISRCIDKNLGRVEASSDRIHQIVMNLCTNAAQAMSEDGGVIKVTYARVADPQQEPFPLYDLGEKELVCLMVGDDGVGIHEECLEKIFDPYFTTKEQGEGTGLGLAVVQGVVASLGGAIRVKTERDHGTVFYIYLPVEEEKGVNASSVAEPAVVKKGNERILFVDDEKTLAEMAGQMLEHLGYQARVFTSSTEALSYFKAHPRAFELIITDLTMPGMSGVEFSRAVTAIRPDIPVILHTGYSTKVDATEARAAGIQSFMIKPLSMVKLSRLVRDVLDGR